MEISQNFVAFSEYMNFNHNLYLLKTKKSNKQTNKRNHHSVTFVQPVELKDFSVLFYECSNLCHGATWLQYARQAQLIYDSSFLFDLQKMILTVSMVLVGNKSNMYNQRVVSILQASRKI